MGDAVPKRAHPEQSPKNPAKRSHRKQHDNASDVGQSVYVANLPWKATQADVEKLFGRYGEVHQATIIMDRRTGRSKGFGFVDMPPAAARTAIDKLNGSQMGGRDIKVSTARPRRKRV